ncbi:MAG: 2OG-Fe(II) oxygenase [Gammaproteobacteria bacterium]
MKSTLKECQDLCTADLLALIRGDFLALRISHFYPRAQCEQVAERVLDYPALRQFKLATRMERYGPSLGESAGSPVAMQAYQQAAAEEVGAFRALCSPYLTPIDKLRLALDEAWPAGAHLGVINGSKAFTGVVRIVNAGGSTEPHQDRLIAGDIDLSASIAEQLAANIYLRTSSKGGELEIWDLSLPRSAYQSIRAPGKAGVLRDQLPPSTLRIGPEQGDLILFRSTSMHAIVMTEGARQRIACATFIGYRSDQQPLVFYC